MSRRRLIALVVGGAVLVLVGFVGVVVATSGSSSDQLVIYSARSHYGEEKPFEGLREGDGHRPHASRRRGLRAVRAARGEGDEHAADVLITVDAANLWRAQAGCSSRSIDSTWRPDARCTAAGADDHALDRARQARTT